jgi:hypothetical protein
MVFAVNGAFGQTEFDKVRELNAKVLNLHGLVQNSYQDQEPLGNLEAGSVFSQRLNALSGLIEHDPDAALRAAFPADLVAELAAVFPEHKASLETYGEWQGTVDVFIRDGAGSESLIRMKTGTEDLVLHFGAGGRPDLLSGDVLSVQGVRAGGRVAVDKAKVLSAVARADYMGCSALGEQKIAVILVNLENSRLPAGVDTNQVRSILLGAPGAGSVDDVWRQYSDGKTWVKRTGTGSLAVAGPYDLGQDFACGDDFPMFQAATKAAEGDLNLGNFSRVLIIRPADALCKTAISSLGCVGPTTCEADGSCGYSWGTLQADSLTDSAKGVSAVAHALGHQIGLAHPASASEMGLELYNAPTAIQKVDSAAQDMAEVRANYSAEACTVELPFFESRPHTLRGAVGKPSTYTITVRNEDSPECAATTFTLSSTRESDGWAGTFDPKTLTLAPGTTGTSKFTVIPPPYAVGETHNIGINLKHPDIDGVIFTLSTCTVPHIVKPGPASNPFPAQDAKGIALAPVLKWTSGDRASFHRVFFGTANPPPFVSGSATNSFSPGLLEPNTQYFWRIEEKNDAGIDATSPVWSFRTKADTLPGKPRRDSPRIGGIIHTLTPTLKWRASLIGGRPTSYDVYLGKTLDPPLVANVPQTRIDLDLRVIYQSAALEYGTQYYWRIVAKNSAGETSSDVWTFTTFLEPGAPRILFPPRGNVGLPRTTHIEWKAATGQIDHYKLYLGPTDPPAFLQNVQGTTLKFSPPNQLAAKTKYFWRVVAVTTLGKELVSDYSWFTTE